MSKLLLFGFLFSSLFSFGQFSNRTKKLIGTWQYKSGNGIEVWSHKNDYLIGNAFRVNKIGDTTKVEDLRIKKVNKNLVYTIRSKQVIDDSSTVVSNHFISHKNKMKFTKIESGQPEVIAYCFGFLNRNKLKIKIQYGFKKKPVKLILFRVKE